MSDAAVFENVSKQYAAGWPARRAIGALDAVSLRVPAGSTLALLGPNRAGKTTLVKLLLSLCRPTAGRVLRLGAPAADPATLARVGYVHENQHFPRYLSAAELLRFYGSLALVPGERLPGRVDELLRLVGLADRRDEPIARFSKGMVQRLGLAQALVNEPELLILDEPTEGLDLAGREMLRGVIARQKARGGTTVLVSHVLAEVERLCDRAAVLVGGRLRAEATMSELLGDGRAGRQRTLEDALKPFYEASAA